MAHKVRCDLFVSNEPVDCTSEPGRGENVSADFPRGLFIVLQPSLLRLIQAVLCEATRYAYGVSCIMLCVA